MREIDQIMHAAYLWKGEKALATVVRTEGSSYRKAGAAMLISKTGTAVGAVSGGCIEKAVVSRAREVFATGEPLMMEYDGRYRLGCNGTLHILIEPFKLEKDSPMWELYFDAFAKRYPWKITNSYRNGTLGSMFHFDEKSFPLHGPDELPSTGEEIFVNPIEPPKQLYILGNERDALKLAELGSIVGYQVTLIGHPRNPVAEQEEKKYVVLNCAPEELSDMITVDKHTAVLLMTHSYSRDLAYLLVLLEFEEMPYLGLLGPRQRREELLAEATERLRELPDWVSETVRGPVGLDIGGELPAEIAVSILAEVQAVFSGHAGGPLSQKRTDIHDTHREPVS